MSVAITHPLDHSVQM